MKTYWFLVPLLSGFGFAGASAFTALYSRWWGEKGGQLATIVLRNILGLPLVFIGLVIAWLTPSPFLFKPDKATMLIGWFFIVTGSIPVIVGHLEIGLPTHMPSVRDKLVRHGLYKYVRHPIYTGMMLVFSGLTLLHPTFVFAITYVLAIGCFAIQARLEEIDLKQRMPDYQEYMKQAPRFIPHLWPNLWPRLRN